MALTPHRAGPPRVRLRFCRRLDRVELSSSERTMKPLEDRVVIITGASSGLGAQLARAVGAGGGIPILAARRAERLAALTEEIPGADAVTCDVTDESDRARLFDVVIERHGRLDGLIN